MEIIIELSLLINVALNFMIIKLSALLVKTQCHLAFFSALIGGIIALLIPLFSISWYIKCLIIILVCSILTCISFRFKKFSEFLKYSIVILFTTFLFGGGCYAVESLVGQYTLFIVCVIGILIYIVSKVVIKSIQRKDLVQKFTYNVILKDNENVIYEEGFLDSGNMLYDSITKKPIILITYDVFNKFYQNINYINAVTKNFDKSKVKDGHFVKINSIGSGASILVFTIDEMQLGNGKTFKDVSVGLSFSGFDKSFGKKILLHSAMI